MVEQCEFKNMRGDGVYIIGAVDINGAYTARNVWVTRCKFFNNNRSGIACQRGLSFFWFVDNSFEQINDQSIDTEASDQASLTDGWILANKIFHDNYSGALALAVGGISDADTAKRIVVANNIVRGGGVLIGKAEHIEFSNNIIIGDTSNRPLQIQDCHNVRVRGGYIEANWANAGAQSALHVQAQSYTTSRISIEGCVVKQAAATEGLDVIGFHDPLHTVSVSGCHLVGNGTEDSNGIRFDVASNDSVTRYGFSAIGNTINNNYNAIMLRSVNSATPINSVTIAGNTFVDTQAMATQIRGIWLDAGNNSDFINNASFTITGNTFGRGITTAIQNDASVNRWSLGGLGANVNAGTGGTLWWVRSGAPSFSAPNGDLAIRADGGSGTTLYVRESGSWVAK